MTFWNFVAMTLSSSGLIWALNTKSFPLFLVTFLTLFVTTGIGNGSTFRMIPSIFRTLHERRVEQLGLAHAESAASSARRESAAVIGIAAAIGALGGYFIPRAFGASISATGSASFAVSFFVAFYVACGMVTWWCYLRRSLLVERVPSLAYASI